MISKHEMHQTVNRSLPNLLQPCAYYDAILPLRVLLLKMHNPKV